MLPAKSCLFVASAFRRKYMEDNRVIAVTESPLHADKYHAVTLNIPLEGLTLSELWQSGDMEARWEQMPESYARVPVFNGNLSDFSFSSDFVCLQKRKSLPWPAQWFKGTAFALCGNPDCMDEALLSNAPETFKILTAPTFLNKAAWDKALFAGTFHAIPMDPDLVLPPDMAVGDALWIRALDRVPNRREPDYLQIHLRGLDDLRMSLH